MRQVLGMVAFSSRLIECERVLSNTRFRMRVLDTMPVDDSTIGTMSTVLTFYWFLSSLRVFQDCYVYDVNNFGDFDVYCYVWAVLINSLAVKIVPF